MLLHVPFWLFMLTRKFIHNVNNNFIKNTKSPQLNQFSTQLSLFTLILKDNINSDLFIFYFYLFYDDIN